MKVILFCGGLGTRIRDYSDSVPKPMINIGYRPIIWHVMKYYAHFGFKKFILCLGYKADVIKEYFLNYNECLSNDFILTKGCKKVELLNKDVQDWEITFVDTGLTSNIGQRLKAVEKYLDDDEEFMANYSDGVTDLNLHNLIDHFHEQNKIASFLCVKPNQSFHVVSMKENQVVSGIENMSTSGIWINGGHYIFKKDIFKYIKEGEELVMEPFQMLIQEDQLLAHKYEGFWACMDTFKEKQKLDELYSEGEAPWEVWKKTISDEK